MVREGDLEKVNAALVEIRGRRAAREESTSRDVDGISPDVIQLLNARVEDVLSRVSPIERRVLQLRFGLEDGKSKTLAETGKIVGMEFRERPYARDGAKKIEARALRRLRRPTLGGL